MIVTTGAGPSDETRAHAVELAARLSLPFVERRNRSLPQLRRQYGTDGILVVTAKGARLERAQGQPFFFHPNNAAFRIKRLERGDTDIMLSVCQIAPGDHVLDATLGLGADAIVFAHGVGEKGRVLGVESEPLIALLVEDGLRTWPTPSASLRQAMWRVEVAVGHHLDVLRTLPDRSFDVVYFDPMFTSAVADSAGIRGIRPYANPEPLSMEAVREALRVARRRVVLKEGKGGTLYKQLGFTPFRTRQHQVVYSYQDAPGGE
ncbi:class I SAM-dependent methyltransferase [Brevibacillus sp. SYP-B805]|uniref:class I SAM-dependent methyltransferase n=1 Tax=Brevibacillus sp. SYP-B805 TaxID=1578199 RepID=UPI0013EC1FBA|nr:class I SAM-dependent methyltransferase [Brevibacillus sp. SYP-B805]